MIAKNTPNDLLNVITNIIPVKWRIWKYKLSLLTKAILAPPNLKSDEPLHVTIDGSSYGSAWVIEQRSPDPVTGVMMKRTNSSIK